MAPMSELMEGMTLDRFLIETRREHPSASGQFVHLMQSIALAGKMISARVNRAGLGGVFGATGEVNVQGEFVQKLDVYANDTFKRALEHGGHTCMVVSEEEEEPIHTPAPFHSGRYVVTFDPLDGSSNIDVNATIGTIFGVYRRKSEEGTRALLGDLLRPGRELVAAGYIIYGSGTILVLTTDDGVHGFSLDPQIGEFFLSHPSIRIPERSTTYSCNEAYYYQWQPGMRRFVDGLRDPGRKYGSRYIGTLIADFHRNLLKGGVFMYPATPKSPRGKLRLLYEAAPTAYLVEKAGGAATDGRRRILDIQPETLHDRVPLIIGGKAEVEEATAMMRDDPLLG
jgi:fructose-1,6-bisphosphatase I